MRILIISRDRDYAQELGNYFMASMWMFMSGTDYEVLIDIFRSAPSAIEFLRGGVTPDIIIVIAKRNGRAVLAKVAKGAGIDPQSIFVIDDKIEANRIKMADKLDYPLKSYIQRYYFFQRQ